MPDRAAPLATFHPLVREWFLSRYGDPTPVQAAAWPADSRGRPRARPGSYGIGQDPRRLPRRHIAARIGGASRRSAVGALRLASEGPGRGHQAKPRGTDRRARGIVPIARSAVAGHTRGDSLGRYEPGRAETHVALSALHPRYHPREPRHHARLASVASHARLREAPRPRRDPRAWPETNGAPCSPPR